MVNENKDSSLPREQVDFVFSLYSKGHFKEAISRIKLLNEEYPNVPLLFNLVGACYKGLGQLEGAIKMFELAITLQPNYGEAHKNLGITLRDFGNLDDALISLKKALTIEPEYIDAYYNLAATHEELGQLDDAVKSYQKAIDLNPNFAVAHNNLGNVFKDLNQFNDAIKSYQKAIVINPNFAVAHNNLGNVFKDLNQFNDAIKSYQKAIVINPNFAEAHNNLGNVFKDLNQFNDAIKSYQKAIAINPNFAEAYFNQGIVLRSLRKIADSVKSFENALEVKPNYAEAHNNLGVSLSELGQTLEAVKCYEKAISIDPEYAYAYNNLGNVFKDLGKRKAAANCYEKAISIKPDYAIAYSNLGNVLRNLKERDKALVCFEHAYQIMPDMDFILGDLLNTKMHLCLWDDLSTQIKELKGQINNNKKVIAPFNLLGLLDDPEVNKKNTKIYINEQYPKNDSLPNIGLYPKHNKIRIGYFSGDFRIHPVATLTAELYERHDRSQFEIHAFSFGPDTKDEMNLRIKAGVDHFHDVRLLSNKDIAILARSFEIDIAIDLVGLTINSRTDVFAMSAAPIQLSYIGYLGTMGAKYYDYLIADMIMIPKENQKHYTEKIAYLPSYQVNDSKDSPPDITFTRMDLGLPEEGFVFCCFNNTYKITPTVFDSWAKILKQVNGSVLFTFADNATAEKNLKKEIIFRGVSPDRLIFAKRLPRLEYLARYRVADLFLDTSPYNAGTTASDSLRMGLPVLTCIGKSYPSRMAASIITAINLPELITTSQKEYELLAIELATDPEKLKIIKDNLMSNLSTAPLYNTSMFTKHLESAYRKMYERYHQGSDIDHIYVEH